MTTDLPSWTPDARELADLELLLSGAFHPLSGFLPAAEIAEIHTRGTLLDGTPWPVPVTLTVPASVAAADRLVLQDPEGVPLAVLTVEERTAHGDRVALAGPVEPLNHPEHGPFRRLRRPPHAVREELLDGPVLGVTIRGWLDESSITQVKGLAEQHKADLLVMPLILGSDDAALIRRVLDAFPQAVVVPLPLPPRDVPAERDLDLRTHLAAAHGATMHVATPDLPRPRPPAARRGLTLFFTGLSGSGKSTIARGVYDALLEEGKSVTYLDGDVVRQVLSSGLTFSKADRDLNIRRIGYVAAEVSRHGGIAICAPIAPYAQTRKAVREMVTEVGGDFLLVHVSAPLEECERRDRKGLYAKARAGLIPEFTGVSDPYEVPDDAELTLDTTRMTVEEAVHGVLKLLTSVRGFSRS
ncbi:adenylyl-sulfate kinase [Rhizohabitans arisaemae]|uniref:adenylyl-sulfate kinase n=1 Tax=Rhizohabitans arisaemae TaxID=2720610 RepID=UPI0024B18379|nr:adenylyl-sulfate kinase [Rhizohabitans arisaemae]